MVRILWVLLGVLAISGLTQGRNKAPLIDEDNTRTRNKAAECIFGKQVRELGSQWIPDLGVPIGVLYCMVCECIPFQKKRRVVARVQCRSIKNECPEPNCPEPIHEPGKCCKTCPGDNHDVIQDIIPQNIIEEEDKSTKHYAALLTGRSSLVVKNDFTKPPHNDIHENNVVATGRFTFHKKNLHYSFYISDKAARPRSLQFVDNEGNILEEFVLSRVGGLVNSLYQNATRKVCGIWRRLSRDYRRLLKQERLYAVLVWGVKDQAEFTLSGQLKKYVALGTELFSSLLEPAPGTTALSMAGAGGTAIISMKSSVPTSIHLAIIFNGIFNKDEISNVPVNITLFMDEKKMILQETIHIEKPLHELNVVEISSPMTTAELRLLTRGRLLLTISSVSHPDSMRLSGNVITKAVCELFQTILSSSPSDQKTNPYGASGLAWLYLNNEGSLVYNIQIDSLRTEQPSLITLVDATTKKKTELEDLTPYFKDGWANGTVDKLSPKFLEPLYSGNLVVNVATLTDNSLIKGRLNAKLVADARDAAYPYLLKRENYSLPNTVVGMAWISVDSDCHIHYDVMVSGLSASSERNLELTLDLLPMLAPGAPVHHLFLDDFQGNQVEGSPVNSLSKEEIHLLDSGVGFLKITDKDTKITLLATTVKHVTVPTTCLSPYTDNNVPLIKEDPTELEQSGACFYEGKFYQEDAQWTSASDACTMCFCQNGVAKCDTMTCPDVRCQNGSPTKVTGECCPICSDALPDNNKSNIPQKCNFNGKSYSPGSKFRPFLIPNGFDLYTECICDVIYLEIKCKRASTNDSNKVDKNINGDDDEIPMILNENFSIRKPTIPLKHQKILEEGGCKNFYNPDKPYANGSEFHPSIESLGEYKCVTCKCQDGNQTCKRQLCDKANCEELFKLRRTKVPVNNTCCHNVKQCKKYWRHRRNHRPPVL